MNINCGTVGELLWVRLKIALLAALAIAVIVLFWFFLIVVFVPLITFYSLGGLFHELETVGINPYMARALIVTFTFVLTFVVLGLLFQWHRVLRVSRISALQIFLGYFGVVAVFVTLDYVLYEFTKDRLIAPDGSPIKGYTIDPTTGWRTMQEVTTGTTLDGAVIHGFTEADLAIFNTQRRMKETWGAHLDTRGQFDPKYLEDKTHVDGLSWRDQATGGASLWYCWSVGGNPEIYAWEGWCANGSMRVPADDGVRDALYARIRERVAHVLLHSVEYGNWSNTFWFELKELNGVAASFMGYEVRIWHRDSPTQDIPDVKRYVPRKFIVPRHIAVPGRTVTKRLMIDCGQYSEWLQGDEWVEVTLHGRDENGHPIDVTLAGAD